MLTNEPVSESYWRERDSGLEEGFAGVIAPPVSNLPRGVVGKEVPAFPSAVQETGCACWPPGLNVKAPDRHACQRVRRLNAVASAVHSAATFIKPRSRNLGSVKFQLHTLDRAGTTQLAFVTDVQGPWKFGHSFPLKGSG